MKATAVREVKSPVGLGLAVLRWHEETCYRLWLLARAIDAANSGRVTIDALRTAAKRYIGYEEVTVRRLLKAGNGLWWTFDPEQGPAVRLVSLLKVSDRLDVTRSGAVNIPLKQFKAIGDFRAALVAAPFAEEERRMSLETLMHLTGRSRGGVRSSLKRAGVRSTPNFMISKRKVSDYCPELARQGYIVDRSATEPRVLRRLPNTYKSALKAATIGVLKHLPSASSSLHGLGGKPRKVYFESDKAAAKAIRRLAHGQTIYWKLSGEKGPGGAQLWKSCACYYMGPLERLGSW